MPLFNPVVAGAAGGATGTGVATVANAGTSTLGAAVVAGAANTKGAYTELFASTAFDVETIVVCVTEVTFQSTVDTSTLLDIAVGAAASEVVLIPDLGVGWRGPPTAGQIFIIPIAIPAGSRVSARIQSAVASKSINVNIELRQHGDHSAAPTTCATYGINAANSHSTTLATPGGVNTKGAYTELTASTSADATRLLVSVQGDSDGFAASTQLVDIATGAAASEVVLIPDLLVQSQTTESIWPVSFCSAYTVNVPAGTRLSARFQATSVDPNSKPAIAVHLLA
jgi:hypothetical protein